jgi:hypothetical protein
LSSDLYFKTAPPGYPQWRALIQRRVFEQRPVAQAWMRGALGILDIASLLRQDVDLPSPGTPARRSLRRHPELG